MKLSKKKPLIWPLVKLCFPSATWGTVIVTWGDTVYCAQDLNSSLIAHEQVHVDQQKGNWLYGLWWWMQYIVSNEFRLKTELPAHQAEYKQVCKLTTSKHTREQHLHAIADRLSGPLYKRVISKTLAIEVIKSL